MLTAIEIGAAGATSFAAGYFLAKRSQHSSLPGRESILALESIARTLAGDVRGHSGTIKSVEAELATATGDSIRSCVRRILDAGTALQTRLQEAEARLAHQAAVLEQKTRASQVDALTQTFNRGALDERLRAAFDRQSESGRTSSLLMIDIDHFKRVNDSFGHLAGDAVLKQVTRRILDAVPAGAFVARYGGEEFAVLLEGATAQECREAAETVRSAIGQGEVSTGSRTIAVSSSAGLADTTDAESVEAWIERADQALYQAKSAGRDRGFVQISGELQPLIPAPISALRPVVAASRDTITGLFTADAFAASLDLAVADRSLGFIVVARLCGYSELIERRGFRAAEGALKEVAAAIRKTTRERDPAARISKATFAVLLSGAERSHADRLSERLRDAFEEATSIDDGLTLLTTTLEVQDDINGKHLTARCVSITADAWFPTSA